MSRRLAALSVLVFAFAVVSYSGIATGQEGKGKATAKGTKKGKAPEKKAEKAFE